MVNYETLVLKLLVSGVAEIIPQLKEDMFSDRYAKIYTLCLEFFDANKNLPSAQELQAVIEARAPISARQAYIAIVKSIEELELPTNPSVIVNGLKESATLKQVDNDIETLVKAARDRDTEKVKILLSKLNTKINLGGVEASDMADVKDCEDVHNIVPSFLDDESEVKFLGGGHSGLTIISAISGGGKTVALLKAARRNYEKGKNVLFITLELPKKVMYNRLMSSITRINFKKINSGDLTKEEVETLAKAHKEYFVSDAPNYFKIIDEPLDDIQLVNLIAVEAQVHKVDTVVIDYVQLVEMAESSDEWRGLSKLAKKLHKLTRTYGITIITASQVNVDGKVKGSILPNITTRGSRELEFSSTQFIHIDVDSETGELIMYTKKNRIDEPQHVILKKEFAFMDIHCTGIPLV